LVNGVYDRKKFTKQSIGGYRGRKNYTFDALPLLFMSSDASSSVDLHYSSDSEDSRTPAPLPPTADDTFEKHPELYEGLDQLFFLKPPQKNPDITFLIETPRPAKYTVRTWNFRKKEVSLVYLESLKGTALDLPKSRPLSA